MLLMQRSNEDQLMHPVYFMSLKTSELEEKYDSYMLEILVIVKVLEKFRAYLLDKEFKIVTDCSAFKQMYTLKSIIEPYKII